MLVCAITGKWEIINISPTQRETRFMYINQLGVIVDNFTVASIFIFMQIEQDKMAFHAAICALNLLCYTKTIGISNKIHTWNGFVRFFPVFKKQHIYFCIYRSSVITISAF